MQTYQVISHTELTVIRPNGETEVISITDKRKNMNGRIFAQIVKGTKEAGKGTVTGYNVVRITKTRELNQGENVAKAQYTDEQKMKYEMPRVNNMFGDAVSRPGDVTAGRGGQSSGPAAQGPAR